MDTSAAEVPSPEPGTEARRRRVAAIATELARRGGFEESRVAAIRRLATVTGEHKAVDTAAASILHVSAAIEELLEAPPHADASLAHIRSALLARTTDSVDPGLLDHLTPLCTGAEIAGAMDNLPVFPTVALRVLAELRSEDSSMESVERLASRDQVLTASILRVANSGLHGVRRDIRTLREAISRVGTDMAAQVVIVASLKPMFSATALRDLWRHSIATAAVCAQLAKRAQGDLSPGEAGVLGLVHDIGRLIVPALPAPHLAAHTRIAEDSACLLIADHLVCGRDHAALGAEVLTRWNFPREFVDAVRFHHRPTREHPRLASILYLAEHLTASSEGIPDPQRLSFAASTTGIAIEKCRDLADAENQVDAFLEAA